MASAQRDYYDILAVPRTATGDEIKKAYRRLARQYHPDLHSGPKKAQMEQKFKELNEAHEVLGDPETRKKYDRYGHRWQEGEAYERARQQAGSGAGADMGPEFAFGGEQDFGDIFETIFGRGSRTGSGSAFRGFTTPGEDLETGVELTLREVLPGSAAASGSLKRSPARPVGEPEISVAAHAPRAAAPAARLNIARLR